MVDNWLDLFSDTAMDLEMQRVMMENSVQRLLEDTAQQVEMTPEDAAWLEDLFQRLVTPARDEIVAVEDGMETEVISPREQQETGEARELPPLTDATDQWHVQEGQNACAVCAQQFIINEFLHTDYSEAELSQLAQERGWFDPRGGTSPYDVGNILSEFGIENTMSWPGSLEEMKAALDQGGRVIVSVDDMAFWTEGVGTYPLEGADHAVEVIGLDNSDPQQIKVIVNDSGNPNGCGRVLELNDFLEAWQAGGQFMVSAFRGE